MVGRELRGAQRPRRHAGFPAGGAEGRLVGGPAPAASGRRPAVGFRGRVVGAHVIRARAARDCGRGGAGARPGRRLRRRFVRHESARAGARAPDGARRVGRARAADGARRGAGPGRHRRGRRARVVALGDACGVEPAVRREPDRPGHVRGHRRRARRGGRSRRLPAGEAGRASGPGRRPRGGVGAGRCVMIGREGIARPPRGGGWDAPRRFRPRNRHGHCPTTTATGGGTAPSASAALA
ncbi:MAG: hypothetical protein MZV64_44295 [Ignavibacteriales bacterium]|nr:hypothetical protein [Ignavibacteriales bacterium]